MPQRSADADRVFAATPGDRCRPHEQGMRINCNHPVCRVQSFIGKKKGKRRRYPPGRDKML